MARGDELKRALSILEGPLRFATRSDQALLNLRGLEALARKAAEDARRLGLTPAQQHALERLLTAASAFDGQSADQRRRSLHGIATETALLAGEVEVETGLREAATPPPQATPAALHPTTPSPEPAGRPRIRPLSAEGSLAPVSVEGEALLQPLSTVRGVGSAMAQKLATRGLHTVGDGLLYLPRSYEDRRSFTTIAAARPGQKALLRGRITGFQERFARRKVYELSIDDGTDTIVARWFGFRPGAYRAFVEGTPVVLSGEVRVGFTRRKEIVHPDLELGEEADDPTSFGRIVPVYTEIEGVSARVYRRLAQRIVELGARHVKDFLPDEFRAAHKLEPLAAALEAVHFPRDDANFSMLAGFATPPQRRLVFDELFFVQLGLALRKRGVQVEQGLPFDTRPAVLEKALARLPFAPTRAQARALAEIAKDLSRPVPMNRLLQGDVGSGKTAVALASALVAVENGYQAALMAPTELLAEQHLRTFEKLLGGGLFAERKAGLPPIGVTLLSAGRRPKEQQRARNEVASGTARIVIGTHALIQGGVEFQNLGLAIIDEQHRFGVMQRARLMEKGRKPHVLVMTATPIPRTLALTLYGDLDVSVIDELPPGRTPVVTKAFTSRTRAKAYEFLRKEVTLGRQAYVVLPLVEESEKLELRSATEEAERLAREEFVNLRVGLVHGRMSSEDRSSAMERFRRGELQVLVATTVIEVGVDVPNASVMLIEHADRFGLSQLHQLRGRVGRGAARSFCLLVSENETSSQVARERLSVMTRTSDGFALAEADLELRGPGEFLGTRQSGMPDLVVADLLRDRQILNEARDAAFALVAEDPDLKQSRHRTIARELQRRWAGKLSFARIG
jgi:ATP-dependent DNA helicase RecG